MREKKIMSEEDLMLDYAEMTSFDFNSPAFQQIQEMHGYSEYSLKPYAFKFGKFDLTDMFKSFIPQE